jgi:hypothetical protein
MRDVGHKENNTVRLLWRAAKKLLETFFVILSEAKNLSFFARN